MPVSISTAADIALLNSPRVLSLADILSLDVKSPTDLIDGIITDSKLSMLIGAKKQGKTVLATQIAIAVATGTRLFDKYAVAKSAPVLIVEVDDQDGAASFKDLLSHSPLVGRIPSDHWHFIPQCGFSLGKTFTEWLQSEIYRRRCKLVILDSYTRLRPRRKSGADIVKDEEEDLTPLGEVARDTGAAILLLHHDSKSSARSHWTDRSAGTYAMGSVPVAQIYLSRFDELESDAPERLVQIRGRHGSDLELLLRFRLETRNYDFVFEGSPASLYPFICQIRDEFGSRSFGPKDVQFATGLGHSTVHRWLIRLQRAEVLRRPYFGQYVLEERFR
jgi:hypothetical protein